MPGCRTEGFDIKTIADQSRKVFIELIMDAITKHKVFRIQHRDGDVVLMSDEGYESLQEMRELLSIRGFRESIKKITLAHRKERNLLS
jgi:PHD/YefM family antitoxin component YafN of YafNO toxin-antitoxin module